MDVLLRLGSMRVILQIKERSVYLMRSYKVLWLFDLHNIDKPLIKLSDKFYGSLMRLSEKYITQLLFFSYCIKDLIKNNHTPHEFFDAEKREGRS